MAKRTHIDPPEAERCEHDARVGRKEWARCGRRKTVGRYCRQHAKMAESATAQREYLNSLVGRKDTRDAKESAA